MISTLKKRYAMGLAPAGLGFLFLALAGPGLGLELGAVPPPAPYLPGALFSLALAFSLGGPVVVRTLFAHGRRHDSHTPGDLFLAFQTRLILTALPAPYFTLAALVWEIPRFHAAGMLLAALYGLYYQYPSRARIQGDRKIFKVP